MNLLLVDDDPRVGQLLSSYLGPNDKFIQLNKLSDVQYTLEANLFDIVLLDINLNDENGLEFLRDNKDIFHRRGLPVFLLSQVKDLEAKLEAFQLGAQDYIVKPFEPLELIARVKAKLHQVQGLKHFEKGDLKFDRSTHVVQLESGEALEILNFSSTEFRLLILMASNEGKIYSRKELLEKVWSEELHVVDRAVDQHISKIRRKIRKSQYTIHTHFGQGYSFARWQQDKKSA